MLRINSMCSGEQAKTYFGEALSKGDYYGKDQAQEIVGQWGGKVADRIGLSGEVDRQAFFDLADHKNPVTGEPLSQRRNTNRRPGYDFTFSASKSISAYYAATGDKRVLQAFEAAVQDTMEKDIEPNIQVRVRQNGETKANRTTGNGLWSSFTHLTSRPVGGVPDPQIHTHVILANVSFDAEYRNRDGTKGAYLAAEVSSIKAAGAYYQAAFHSRLASRLSEMGFAVRQAGKSFELAGFTPEMKSAFSRRTAEIEDKARELGISYEKDKAELGAKTRNRKRDDLSMSELHDEWRSRFSEADWNSFISTATSGGSRDGVQVTDKHALEYGFDHMLERQSVARRSDVLAHALQRGVGSVTPESIKDAYAKRDDVISAEEDGQTLVTTTSVLEEEAAMIRYAREGRGTVDPLGSGSFRFEPVTRDGQRFELGQQQKQAVQHILSSRSKITMIRGAAGAGKTSALTQAIRGVEENGRSVHCFAPTAAARDVLQKDGKESGVASLRGANTVAKLLSDSEMQAELRGQVILIDEAGLMSTKDMKRVFDVAEEQNARVVLVGDHKQHSSVARGQAAKILISQAGIRPAEINEVRRQRNEVYRSAVKDLSRGTRDDVISGFDKLERMGLIHEISDPERRNRWLAEGYVETVKSGQTCLVVAPTHVEGEQCTTSIRKRLKEKGLIDSEEKSFRRLKNLQLTTAQKSNPETYEAGQVIEFHRPAKSVPSSTFEMETVLGLTARGIGLERRFERRSRQSVLGYTPRGNVGLETRQPVRKGLTYGERLTVIGRDKDGTVHARTSTGDVVHVPLSEGERYSVYEPVELKLAAGDRVRITQNGYTHQRSKKDKKHRLTNGSLRTVQGFSRDGHIVLDNGWVVDKDAGHLNYGYVTTSHASQGKTVDMLYLSQSSQSFPASSMAQFYVSVSRARNCVVVVSDDKDALRNYAILRSNDRMAATELAAVAGSGQQAQKEEERAARQRKYVERLNRLADRARKFARAKAEQIGKYYDRFREQMKQREVVHER